jgi:RHS repeat-associated protein
MKKNNEILDNYFFKYDFLNRLIEEKYYFGNTFNYHKNYKYNDNSDITEIIEIDSNNEPLRKSVYTYSSIIKGQLNNITIYIYEGNDRWSIDYVIPFVYSNNDPFRPSTYKDNTLTWQGRRLTSYGTNTYLYNSEGIRISKTTSSGTYNYILEDKKIIKETKPTYGDVYYHYDSDNILVGFHYNNNEYFYVRDIAGNIIQIIDINGNIIVEYKYDAWGKIISIIGDNTIKNVNSYLYKGYYYDYETNLYYCKSRYYDPEVRRWISIDDISYLDNDSAVGINLWCYCNNNPVMYSDEDGTFAISTLLIGLAISSLVSWGLAEVFGGQIAGGIGSTINGAGAIYTGVGLLAFGPVGWIAGGLLILIGVGTVAFGVNNIVAGVSGTNYIQSWTGISDGVYLGVNLSLNIASIVGTIAGNAYMNYADVSGNVNPGREGKPFSRYSTLDDKGVKQYRFFDSQGNAWFDKDFRHPGNLKFPHYHGWNDGTRLVEHWSIWELLKWLIEV